jgi:hypothetical protein
MWQRQQAASKRKEGQEEEGGHGEDEEDVEEDPDARFYDVLPDRVAFSVGPSAQYRTYALQARRPIGYDNAMRALDVLAGRVDETDASAYKSKTGSGLSASALVGNLGGLKAAESSAMARAQKLMAGKRHDRMDKIKKQQKQG